MKHMATPGPPVPRTEGQVREHRFSLIGSESLLGISLQVAVASAA